MFDDVRLPSCLAWAGCLAGALAACSSPLGPGTTGTSVTYTTTWERSVNRDLDVLYVVDASPASASLQDKVAAQLPVLMSQVQQCTGADGVLPNVNAAVVSSTTGQLLASAAAQLPGFLRPQAHLQLIFISDADDTSTGTVSDFVASFRALKVDPDNQIAVSAVVGASAPRLTELANAFPNSVIVSDGADSFAAALGSLCAYLPVLLRPPCLPAAATDCVVTEQLTAADGVRELAIPPCADAPAGAGCWEFHDGYPGCLNDDRPIAVENQPTGSDPARYSVQVLISCQLPAPAP